MGAHYLASSVLYQIISNHINTDINDNNDSQSFETPRKNNRSYASFGDTKNATTTPVPLKDHLCFYQQNTYKTPNVSNIPPPVKKYPCFEIEGKTIRTAQYDKSRVLTKVIYTLFETELFEQKYVILKGFLNYERLKQHMATMRVYQ